VERDVFVAELPEALEREGVVRALGFLQAQHVRLRAAQEPRHQIDAQTDRVDVPGGDLERHACSLTCHSGLPRSGKPGIQSQFTVLRFFWIPRPRANARVAE